MSVASVGAVKTQNPKAGLSPAMVFLGKKLFAAKKNEFVNSTLSTPGKIIGSTLALAGTGFALKTLYDYVMDITDSTWNKVAYLGSSALCGVLSLGAFISSNVSENYKISTPEERLKDRNFKEEVFRNVTSSILKTFKTPREINEDVTSGYFESIERFAEALSFADKSKTTNLPYYSMKLNFITSNKFNIEPIDDNHYIYRDNKSRHNYTLRFQFDIYSFDDYETNKIPFDVYILAKPFNNNDDDYKQVGGPYSLTISDLDNWLDLNIPYSQEEMDYHVPFKPHKTAHA